MAAAAAAAVVATPAAAKVSLDVLDVIRTAQSQNGLRHNDYERYAAYCTRRLHRIRHARPVAQAHSYIKGKKEFVAKVLTAEEVTDARHLAIPLMNAERAWALAQKYAQEVSDGSGSAKERYHPTQRLRKASKYADELEALAAARGDARTALEAQAYAAWMRGTLAVAVEQWEAALTAIATARRIYEELAPSASRRLKELLLARAAELAPTERFCRYTLSRTRGGGGGGGGGGDAAAAGAPALGEKIAAALAEAPAARGGSADASGANVYWRGTHLPVRNPKLRSALAAAADKARQLLVEGAGGVAASKAEALYLEVLSRYDEASRLAAAEASRGVKESKAEAASDAAAVEQYIKFTKSRHVLDRTAGEMVADAVAALNAAATGKPAAAADGDAKATAAAAAAGATTSAAAPFAANPWLAALAGVSTHQALATAATGGAPAAAGVGASVEGVNAEASAAATSVAALYARAMRTVDDMIVLAGGVPPSDNPLTAAANAAAAAGGGGGGGAGKGAAAPLLAAKVTLAADADLVAALTVRRAGFMAWRAYYLAVAAIHAKRFSDATVLMLRAEERAHGALDLLPALPASLAAKSLPPAAVTPVTEGADALPAAVVASGLSAADAAALRVLRDRIAQQTVGLQATALLEQLAPRLRLDGNFSEVYSATFGNAAAAAPRPGSKVPQLPPRLVRSTRPSSLAERMGPTAAVEASVDAAAVTPWPLAPIAVPFKPLLLDLAFNGVAFPDMSARVPDAYKAAPASAPTTAAATPTRSAGAGAGDAAAGGAGGGGLLKWLTGSS